MWKLVPLVVAMSLGAACVQSSTDNSSETQDALQDGTPVVTESPEAAESPETVDAPFVVQVPEVPAVTKNSEILGTENTVTVSVAADAYDSLATDIPLTISIGGARSDTLGGTATPVITLMQSSRPVEPVYLTSETTASMNLPFSDAVRVGHLLFLSGQIGNVSGTTELVPGGIQAEARQTMEKIKTILEANGSSLDRVVKATVMLADIAEWPAFNEVYVTYFPGNKPARSAFAGSGLAFGARCEVEVIATVGE